MDHRKYDEKNEGIKTVFDIFYRKIEDKGIQSTLVTCPGKDVDRYIKYASMVCKGRSTKAYFFENKTDHLSIIKNKLLDSYLKITNRIKVIYGDVTSYETLGGPNVARVEDLGLGIGIRSMTYHGMLRLYKQSTSCVKYVNNKADYRVQIINSALRSVSPRECCKMFQKYLDVLGLKMKSFNDIDAIKNPSLFTNSKYADEVMSYVDKIGRTCKLYKHNVELFPSDRYKQVTLDLYSYINGSNMLQSMLIYK